MIAEALAEYFERLLAACQREGEPLQYPFEGRSPAVVKSLGDDLVVWRPVVITKARPLPRLASTVHESVRQYLTSYWFLYLGGALGDLQVELTAVPNWRAVEEYEASLADYAHAHGGKLTHAPIGFDAGSSRLLVIAADGGAVFAEDEPGSPLDPIAANLEVLIRGLSV
jgi:hypothetical protein